MAHPLQATPDGARPTGSPDADHEVVFARRAEELAARVESDERQDDLHVVAFAIGRERFALPSRQVLAVRPLPEVTPLPGMPACLAGLVNVRGRIVAVLDLRPLFGVLADPTPGRSLVLVAHARGEVGVLATDRPALLALRPSDLGGLALGAPAGLDPGVLLGVAPGARIVLDAERLLADPRLLIQEQGSSKGFR